jgi:PIN domain nuclease of toxin-antitoxin system
VSETSETTRVLLDTNAFLYFINNDPALGKTARNLLESEIDLLMSSASLWEIAIKLSIGKLTLPDSFTTFIPSQLHLNDIEILPIALLYLEKVSTLPFHHKDPFDRLIIAQSLIENLSVASSDAAFDSYGIERIW